MRQGELKKEFYFTNDVFKEVSTRLSISETLIKEVFSDYLKDLKQHILETDHLAYSMSPLGVLTINSGEVNKMTNLLTRKWHRTKVRKDKAIIKTHLDNFKMRQKRLRIEAEKFSHIYPDEMCRTYLDKEKNVFFKPVKHLAQFYNNSVGLKEASTLQNKYAYEWYKKKNKPINH